MQRITKSIALATVLSITATTAALGQAAAPEGMQAITAKSLTWVDADIPGFAPGMKLAAINGDPAAAGPYTLRLSFPDGYRFPAHWHPMTENLTVLSGTLLLTMGERPDESKLTAYNAGDFLHIPATMPHSGGALGFTVIQLHGQGPFTINLVSPAK